MANTADGTIRTVATMADGGFVGTIGKFIGTLSSFASKMTKVQAVLAATGLLIAVVLVKAMFKASREMRELENQTANLAKVLSGIDEARGLANQISLLSTTLPVARNELLRVAEVAARLGVRGTAALTEFTRVAAMIGVATDLSADQAADSFARILKQTRTPISGFQDLADVVNELANNMATSTSEIVESLRRAAPELSRFGLQAEEIAVFSASLNEVSESASRAGTRLRILGQEVSDPGNFNTFAEALKISRGEFEALIASDPRGALMQIITAFGAGGRAAEFLSSKLNKRVRTALAALSQNIEGIELGFKLMDEQGQSTASSLEREFGIFDETIDALTQRIKNTNKELRRKVFGERLQKDIRETIENWNKLLTVIFNVREAMGFGSDPLDDTLARPQRIEKFRDNAEDITQQLIEYDKAARGASGISFEAAIEINKLSGSFEGLLEMLQKDKDFAFFGSQIALVTQAMVLNKESAEDMTVAMANISPVLVQVALLMEDMRIARERFGDDPGFKKFEEDTKAAVLVAFEFGNQAGPGMLTMVGNLATGLAKYLPKLRDVKSETTKYIEAAEDYIEAMRNQNNETKLGKLEALKLTSVWKDATEVQQGIIEGLFESEMLMNVEREALKRLNDEIVRHVELLNRRINASVQSGLESGKLISLGVQELEQIENRIALLDAEKGQERDLLALRQKQAAEMEKIYDTYFKSAAVRDEIIEAKRIEHFLETLELLNQLGRESGLTELQKASDELDLSTAKARMDLLINTIEDLGDASGEVFDAMIGKSGDLGDALVEMIQRVARTIFESQITSLLFKAFAALLPNTGGRIEDIGKAARGFGQSASPGLIDSGKGGKFASGGHMRAGQLGLVGERGPELFVPDVSGNIIPNSRLSNSGGESFILNNHFTINAMDGGSVRTALVREKKTIQAITMSGISKSRNLKKSGAF